MPFLCHLRAISPHTLYAKNGKDLLVDIHIGTGINSASKGSERKYVLNCEYLVWVEFFGLKRWHILMREKEI